jgi:hypothetical protein
MRQAPPTKLFDRETSFSGILHHHPPGGASQICLSDGSVEHGRRRGSARRGSVLSEPAGEAEHLSPPRYTAAAPRARGASVAFQLPPHQTATDIYQDENVCAPRSRQTPANPNSGARHAHAPLGDNFVQYEYELPALPAICRGAVSAYTNHVRVPGLPPAAYYSSYSGVKMVQPPGGASTIVF